VEIDSLGSLGFEQVKVGVILLVAIDKAGVPDMCQKPCRVPVLFVPVRNMAER
jgi:hypothetical protein